MALAKRQLVCAELLLRRSPTDLSHESESEDGTQHRAKYRAAAFQPITRLQSVLARDPCQPKPGQMKAIMELHAMDAKGTGEEATNSCSMQNYCPGLRVFQSTLVPAKGHRPVAVRRGNRG